MASPNPSGPAATRKQGARAPPLQTNNIPPSNARYSYQETPVEMQRPVFHQFSSPTNSTIDESPISTASPSRALPSYQQGAHLGSPPLPEEKSQVQPPAEMHPAYYAPYKEQTPVAQRAPELPIPQSPGPIPMKTRDTPQAPAPVPTPSAPTPAISPPQQSHPTPQPDTNPLHASSIPGPDGTPHPAGQLPHPSTLTSPHWQSSLCIPDPLCLTSLVCPCLIYGRTNYRLTQLSTKASATDLLGYSACNGSCGLMALACGFQWALAAIHRTRIRRLYKIEGGVGGDCVRGLCCCCCVIAQNEREVRGREEGRGKFGGGGGGGGGYVAPNGGLGMSYAPPPRRDRGGMEMKGLLR